MTKRFTRSSFYILLPLLAGTCWGLAGIFVRELTKAGLDNTTIVFTRTAAGTILTLIWILGADFLRRRRKPVSAFASEAASPPPRRPVNPSLDGHRSLLYMRLADMPVVLGCATAGSLFLMPCYNIAVNELSLALASILLATAPVFVLLIGAFAFHEKITKKKTLCMLLVLIGCIMLSGLFDGGGSAGAASGGAAAGGLSSGSFFGFLMGMLSAVFNAAFMILSKVIAKKGYNSFTVTFWSYLFATIVLAFFTDWSGLISFVSAAPAGHLAFLFIQSVCTSLIPSITYIVAMRHVEAGRVAILESGSEPSAAFLAGLILYAEVPTLAGLIGMILTVIAIMVLTADQSS